MKLITYVCLAFATGQVWGARLVSWTPGQRINWDRCEQGSSIESVRLVHPSGEEVDPPESHLELTLKIREAKLSRHVISVDQAHYRGFSLDGLRVRLTNEAWRSVIALKIEADGTVTDFILREQCELPLLRTLAAN